MVFQTLIQLRAELESGATTAEAVAKDYIARATEHNGALNAFVDFDAEHILQQAQASDSYRRQHGARPLEGLPIAIKDIFCTRDGLTQCCSNILRNFHAPYDAHVITRLRDAGAILFGKTNMDEFAMGSSNES
ncbi:MAG: amidase, partial [Mariprofundales bacterium]|nr:amidase [Mariprofundales bacterium]